MAERIEILSCTCKHQSQDEIYGSGKRLHNVNKKGEAFCTVCCPSIRSRKFDGRNRTPKKVKE